MMNSIRFLDLGLHALTITWLIILLRKADANGFGLNVIEFSAPILVIGVLGLTVFLARRHIMRR